MPSESKIRQKMIYAGTKSDVKRSLQGISTEIAIAEMEEAEEDRVTLFRM
jgi:hypothetical protein